MADLRGSENNDLSANHKLPPSSTAVSNGNESRDHLCNEVRPGERSFYELPSYYGKGENATPDFETKTKLLAHINENVIGSSATFSGPYGVRSVVYCDYTASGRALESFEDFIQDQVMPMYGNVHTTTTVTSLQSTLYRHEARDIVRNAVKASEYDAVIFVGNGCTGAVHKLINGLGLQSAPVVFVSPFEHHSSILPWKELGSTVIRIPQDSSGLVDIRVLETELQKWQSSGRQLIGTFLAASNITGILSDTVGITVLLHKYNALAFWDYATAGPYVDINMNPVVTGSDQYAAHKDAIFLSPHKFVGGVDTPGLLVVKKRLFRNVVPTGGGGGSVFFVSREHHRYLKQIEMREEGGTPSIVGAIRAGLAFQLKEAVGTDTIMEREEKLCQQALERWSSYPDLLLLGSLSVPRLPIFSFMVRHPLTRQLLHHNFTCALLNDVFGIQARGGCACAGPYAQDVLGIGEELAHEYESLLLEEEGLDRTHLRRYHEFTNTEVLRPGFARINLPYFMDDECASFVLDAVAMVAEHGWKLLPQYMFNPETGEWKQTHHQSFQDRRWLGSISYTSGEMHVPPPPVVRPKGPLPVSYQECLQFAEQIFATAEKKCRNLSLPDQTLLFPEDVDRLRWFMLPSEALALMQGKVGAAKLNRPVPFEPPPYPLTREDLRKVTVMECVAHHCVSGCSHAIPADVSVNAGGGGTVHQQCGENHANDQQGLGELATCNVSVSGEEKDWGLEETTSGEDNGEGAIEKTTKAGQNMEGSESGQDPLGSPTEQRNADLGRFPGGKSSSSTGIDKTGEGSNMGEVQLVEGMVKAGPLTDGPPTGKLPQETLEKDGPPAVTPSQESLVKVLEGIEADATPHNSSPVSFVDGDGDSGETNGRRVPKVKFHPPPKRIFKPAVQALEEYQMIEDSDRVLVCLSGGKDSLSLLHTIKQYQYQARKKGINFEFGAVTVDPQTPAYDPSPLKDYLAELGVPYFYEEQSIIEQATKLEGGCNSICSFCARVKRGRIYACARREGYNVLAMGQHLDDLAESFFMSVFHNGFLRTMKANYLVQEGDLRVIRPLVYVREKDLREFADGVKLPVIPENCPACFEAPKERHRTKQLLASQEILFPNLYQSLQTAMKPLMAKNRTGLESIHRRRENNSEEVQT